MSDLIFDDGYRANVGIVICNPSGKVFFGKRRYQSGWQFPQGGIKEGESPKKAMWRELLEETGLKKKTPNLLRLRLIGINTISQRRISEKTAKALW